MKKARMLAWLLIVAMLTLACPAIGEELEVDLAGNATAELPDGIGMEVESETDDLAITDEEAGDDLSLELYDLELPDLELSDALDDGLEDFAANGEAAGALTGSYRPRESYDNDALFAGYVDMLFGKADTLGLKPNGWAGDRLSGVAAKVYDYLVKQIKKVAEGTLSDTRMLIPENVVSYSEAETALNALTGIIDALLVDYPYHLFWYDKTAPSQYGYEDGVYIYLPVAEEYSIGTYTTDTSKIKSAQVAATNAKKVVEQYAGVSDYVKLCGYKDYICDAVEYYDDAATDPNMPYGNPWQLIWAFDGDRSTNIVCEGYAKAFQYLCDLSSFSGSIQSHIVNGYAWDQGGSGPHMWNVVTMENGRNYHVDVTFVDSGFTQAFLCGAAATQNNNVYLVKNEVYYQFDDETLRVYPAKVLKLSTSDYQPGGSDTPEDPEDPEDPDDPEDPEDPEEPGDDDMPTGISIVQGSSATLYMGNKLKLTAEVTPADAQAALSWESSNPAVAVVSEDGVVTPKKAGKATITVTTENGLSASIAVKVVDASSVKLKKGSKTLKKGQSVSLARGKSFTLKAAVSPSKVKTKLTWKSSNKLVTVKNGKVTVNRKAKSGTKAKITVKTANGKSTYIYIVVK